MEPLTRKQIEERRAHYTPFGRSSILPDTVEYLAMADAALHYLDERDAALQHVGEAPTMERLRAAHSKMPEAATLYPDQVGGHRVYKQGHDEQCYICAALDRADMYETWKLDAEALTDQALAKNAVLEFRVAQLEDFLRELPAYVAGGDSYLRNLLLHRVDEILGRVDDD